MLQALRYFPADRDRQGTSVAIPVCSAPFHAALRPETRSTSRVRNCVTRAQEYELRTPTPGMETEPMTHSDRANLTDVAMKRWSDIPDPRLREVVQSLIKHLHGFVREVELKPQEWFAGIDWLTRTGQMCSGNRQEFILTSDVLAVSMLIDAINNRRTEGATPSTVEGPFHVPDAPPMANGANMADGAPGIPCFVTGTVRGLSGEPVAGAVLDLWQTDGEGRYEAQREGDGAWMRGLYRTQADGSYAVRTVAPISYTIPMDGTVGELVKRPTSSHAARTSISRSPPGFLSSDHAPVPARRQVLDRCRHGVRILSSSTSKSAPGKRDGLQSPAVLRRYDFVWSRSPRRRRPSGLHEGVGNQLRAPHAFPSPREAWGGCPTRAEAGLGHLESPIPPPGSLSKFATLPTTSGRRVARAARVAARKA